MGLDSVFLNLTIFAENRVRVGPNSEGTASGCSDSHKVAENKKREAWANARWIGMKKSPVDFSIARKGGEFVFLRFAIKSFTECLSVLRYAIKSFTE